MAIARVTATWTGFVGAPGYTNIFFDAFGGGDVVDAEVDRVQAFFNRVRTNLPSVVTINVDQEVAVFDESSGELLGYSTATEAPEPLEGTQSGSYAAPAGAVITWNTDTVNRGRRVRGRTFIVPMSDGVYQSDGTLTSSAIDALGEAADLLMGDGSGPDFVIWSRPRGGSGGAVAPVTSYRVPDMAAVLRSRRD